MRTIFFLLLTVVFLYGCEVDNFPAPNLTLSGKITDSQTNQLVESGGTNAGSIVKLFQDNSLQPLIFTTYPDGTFINSRVFAGHYTYTAEGPFTLVSTNAAAIDMRDNTAIEIKVVPNVRLSASVVSRSGSSAVIKVAYEKVPADQRLQQLAVVWSTALNPNLFTFSGGNVVTKDVSSLDLAAGEQEFTIDGLQPGTVYYIRAAARTNAPGNYYNYSSQLPLQ